MPIVDLKALKAALPKGRRLLGIDQSRAVLGLAVSNPELSIATPLQTIRRTKFTEDVKTLAALCREYGIGGIVIGLPLNMDGSEGPRVDSVKHFADNLLSSGALDPGMLIAFADERLSSDAAESFLHENTRLTHRERNAVIDQLAAQMILQGALESL